jgi:hypothetical protein
VTNSHFCCSCNRLSRTDLSNLGVKKLGERNKLLAKIAKLKANDRVTLTESETSSASDNGGGGYVRRLSLSRLSVLDLRTALTQRRREDHGASEKEDRRAYSEPDDLAQYSA